MLPWKGSPGGCSGRGVVCVESGGDGIKKKKNPGKGITQGGG